MNKILLFLPIFFLPSFGFKVQPLKEKPKVEIKKQVKTAEIETITR
jgi:hypothetical protein